ncbi:cytochrome c peroxidase [Bradyrhizobium sp. Leo121]|uniref:cytochrome-c peroxidase n=1 Tax=Bradyrhizobium sp. Leo121 TaxID=1571195 RepID=UPI001FDFD697|nr:cytochrome c peroxidase [Bradyrhizobium sp. Leo121]
MMRLWSLVGYRRSRTNLAAAQASALPEMLRARRWPPWACAALLLIATGAATQTIPTAPASRPIPIADQEPITPIPEPTATDPLKLVLGERLFADTRLSNDGKLACSSCHDITTNGASRDSAMVRHDGSDAPFDTLTIFNAALSFRLNWEGNYRTLESQAESSLENPANMATSMEDIVARLNADPEMVRQFRAAYGRAPDRACVLDALATFEKSLITPGSRFDRWLAGDTSALSAAELRGYEIFKSFGCISCHQGVNIGGNLFQRQGIFRPLVHAKPDVVRVPSLRNVATTAPYFHDGSAATLEEAVRKMAAAQLDRTLTDDQVTALVAFLQTLTGNYRGIPVKGSPP